MVLQSGNIVMTKKNILILSIVIQVLVHTFLFSFVIVNRTDASDFSGFMDLESAIKALEMQVVKARRSIVMIVAYNKTGEESGRGSGIFIDSEGRIITNALVMKDAYSAEVFRGPHHYKEVVILNRREDLDLAIIQVKATNVTPVELDVESEVKTGERVIVVGKSSPSDTTVSEGLISTISSIGETIELVEIETLKSLLS
jgi:S1-C subfamily serine protease